MKILVTGPDGFVGRHLCRALREAGHSVSEMNGPHAIGGVELTNAAAVRGAVEAAAPDAIVHLAAVSSVAQSHREPAQTFAVNTQGTVNLLVAAHEVSPKARLLIVSSGEVYGRASSPEPTTEAAELAPLSPYAASKVAAEVAALQFQRCYGTDVCVVRPFAHLGAGQATQFVLPSFAEQIAGIRRGTSEPVLKHGNLSPLRDFLHVDDVVAAYSLLLEKGAPGGIYNVASGSGRTVQSLVEEMLELSRVQARLEVDEARMRPAEIPVLVGNSQRIRDLGWAPRRDVRTGLLDVLREHGAL